MHLTFFHSQVRINIECAFSVPVHRWGCLRKPIPPNISIPRITDLVKCLLLLHNFCINEYLLCKNDTIAQNRSALMCDPVNERDLNNILISGGFGNGLLDCDGNQFNNQTNR